MGAATSHCTTETRYCTPNRFSIFARWRHLLVREQVMQKYWRNLWMAPCGERKFTRVRRCSVVCWSRSDTVYFRPYRSRLTPFYRWKERCDCMFVNFVVIPIVCNISTLPSVFHSSHVENSYVKHWPWSGELVSCLLRDLFLSSVCLKRGFASPIISSFHFKCLSFIGFKVDKHFDLVKSFCLYVARVFFV